MDIINEKIIQKVTVGKNIYESAMIMFDFSLYEN